jgi:Ran GTPase-activating protein (RanGAP) involved in mRNA processing and transport
MTLNKDLLGSAHPDELKHFISDNLLNPLTNEHIRDTLYRESKKLAIYGIEKFSEREKRLKEDDDYVDEIVEYF